MLRSLRNSEGVKAVASFIVRMSLHESAEP
jgi:hypothetical protein